MCLDHEVLLISEDVRVMGRMDPQCVFAGGLGEVLSSQSLGDHILAVSPGTAL